MTTPCCYTYEVSKAYIGYRALSQFKLPKPYTLKVHTYNIKMDNTKKE